MIKRNIRVIGIDPGTVHCGYGIVEGFDGKQYYLKADSVNIPRGGSFPERLNRLYTGLEDIIDQYSPDQLAIERIFYSKSIRSALALGHMRGIALLLAAKKGIEVFEYSPLEVKMAVVGYGRAEKRQVQEMVKAIFNLGERLKEDASDALAIALCHLNSMKLKGVGL